MKLTAIEIQARLTEIAQSVTDDVIRLADKRQLETWAKGLFPISKLRKAELAETLINLLASTRQQLDELARAEEVRKENEKRAAELDEQQKNIERAAYLEASRSPEAIDKRIEARKLNGMLEQTIEKTAGKLWDALFSAAFQASDHESLLESIAGIFSTHIAKEVSSYSATSQKDRMGDIKKLLWKQYDTIEPMMATRMGETIKTFTRMYSKALAETVKALNKDYETRVTSVSKDLKEIDARPMLVFAINVLNDPTSDWRDISIALIISTGRRMSEIHGDGSFELVDSNHVRFTGQMKTKGRGTVESFEIPTLVPSGLVMNGLRMLAEKGKRFQGTEDLSTYDIVNAKVSKPLSTRMGALRVAWDVPAELKMTYKDCRALYAEICWELFANQRQMSKPGYLSTILGHDEDSLKSANSYIKYSVTI